MSDMPIAFEHPIWLFLLVLLIPIFVLSLKSIGGVSKVKAWVSFTFRALLVLVLVVTLTEPSLIQRGEGVTVTMLLDRSQSVPLPLKRSSLEFLRDASEARESRQPEDRIAVITIARDAAIAAMPHKNSTVQPASDVADPTATNLETGIKTAMAIMPDDTANRILLVSDGNETVGDVLEAAREAEANNIPVDVLVLEYEHENEVIFERIVAPSRVRLGQSANVNLVLRSQAQTTGTVYLSMNGDIVDLNGQDVGDGFRVQLEPGPKVFQVPLSLDDAGPMKFEASFVPDDPASDYVSGNNSALAVTFVGAEGKVLVVDDGFSDSQYLVQALQESEIQVDVRSPGGLGDLVFLSGYDAVILANIPRYAIDDDQDRMFHAYVHDMGGGLVMLGGPESFGAGGWNESETKKVLPLKLDPPQSRQMPRGALCLIMHSCEMPQANFWGQRVAEAAIEALSRLDYAGIIEYNWGNAGANAINGCSWAFPLQVVGDKSAAIAATKQMVVGDMPDFGSSMTLAVNGLSTIQAGQKHVIVISDGDPSPPSQQLLNQYVANKVTIATVMVGGHGTAIDRTRMQQVATATGGNFYNVTNPKNLPQIFIKEAQLVSRNLIQEGEQYQPQVRSGMPGPVASFGAVPYIEGYVLTAPREGLTQNPIVIPTTEGNDPLYANWNYGLGRSIAYTSDLTGRWGSAWASWAEFREFWEQSIRWAMRPSSPRNVQVNTRREGDLAIVEVEALEDDTSFLNFLNARARVLGPDGSADAMSLQQTGPGRYRGTFKADDAGAYLVNITYPGGDDGSQAAHVQAAVTVPYASEYKATKHNRVLLQQLADATGGRVLSAGDPAIADLFKRDDLEIPLSLKDIWGLLVIAAATLLIFDVASRRLSVDPRKVRGAAARAVGRQREKSEDTVAAWKRARSSVSSQQKEKAKQRQSADQASTRFEADESDAATSIDVGKEKITDLRDQPQQRQQPENKPAASEDDGDYTSRLLKAKRRAAGDEDADGEGT